MSKAPKSTKEEIKALKNTPYPAPPEVLDENIEHLVTEIISYVADKWTMILLEILEENGTQRFSELGQKAHGISQKMLTKTLRQMERNGLIQRKIYPVIPPKVEYTLTPLGQSLGNAFCGVWLWAETHQEKIKLSRQKFDSSS